MQVIACIRNDVFTEAQACACYLESCMPLSTTRQEKLILGILALLILLGLIGMGQQFIG